MDKIYYYCIWFTTTVCPKGFDHGSHWVQSFFERDRAYKYYHALKSGGKVKIWGTAECQLDTASVRLDSLRSSDYRSIPDTIFDNHQ